MSRRTDRINVLLRQEISRVLASDLRDPRISPVVSITRVETSPDLRVAKVFISVFGDETDKSNTLGALVSASGFVRKRLSDNITLRSLPAFEFRLDETIEQGSELLKLIDEVSPGPPDGDWSQDA